MCSSSWGEWDIGLNQQELGWKRGQIVCTCGFTKVIHVYYRGPENTSKLKE